MSQHKLVSITCLSALAVTSSLLLLLYMAFPLEFCLSRLFCYPPVILLSMYMKARGGHAHACVWSIHKSKVALVLKASKIVVRLKCYMYVYFFLLLDFRP